MRTDRCVHRTAIGLFRPRHRDCMSRGADESGCPPRAAAASFRSLPAIAWHCLRCEGRAPTTRSTGKSTPGRGISCRSNASPCRSTIPGSTSRPLASRPNAPRPSLAPMALIFPPAICSEVSGMSSSRSTRPRSMKMSVTIRHFALAWVGGRRGWQPHISQGNPRPPAFGNQAAPCAGLHGPSPTTQAPSAGWLRSRETAA
jgi:hypothetical protein